jgi:hypothetical protein
VTRDHEDLEIEVPRGEFASVRKHFAGYEMYCVGDGNVRRLADDAEPPAELHQNWVLDRAANAWRLDVMLERGDATTWVFRRDPRIRAPRAQMIGARNGIPYLLPQGTLLYKAKPEVRAKDEADLLACLPRLDADARTWLRDAIAIAQPGHAWIDRLR